MPRCFILWISFALFPLAHAQEIIPAVPSPSPTLVAPIPSPVPQEVASPEIAPGDIVEFDSLSLPTQQIILAALRLTQSHLKYQFGSADPNKGGMDCSGTIYYILKQVGMTDVPRQSNEQYQWTWEHATFRAVSGSTFKSFEFQELKPGDLLFWTGTYDTVDRDPPVSHVMIYLGTQKGIGKKLMFGATEGRTFDGKIRSGVSVFDFFLPSVHSTGTSRFIGYAEIPGITSLQIANKEAPTPCILPDNPSKESPTQSPK